MRHPHPPGTNSSRRGTALALLAVGLVLIFSVLALTLDGGVIMADRHNAQAIADATAYAAAGSLYKNFSTDKGLDPSGTAKKLALAIAADNGYSNDGTTSTVTVNIPPQSGLFSGQSCYAEAIVSQYQPKYFSAIWGAGTMTVTARSVARALTAKGYGFLLLDPSMPKALSSTGGAGVTVTNGDITVDSSNSNAVEYTGSGQAIADNINITGSYKVKSNTFVGTVKTGVTPTADPLASLPAPSMSGMTVQYASQLHISGGNWTIYPGVYDGGISMSGGTLTMMPGIYYLNGGGFRANGNSTITGNGVMIYNAAQNANDQIKMTGSGGLTLSPPTTGTYAGISIFQDRTSDAPFGMTGSGAINVTGGVYVPKAVANLTGQGGTNVAGSFMIANNAIITGGGAIKIGVGSSPNSRDLRIVE